MTTQCFDNIIICRFGKTNVAKEEVYGAKKLMKNEIRAYVRRFEDNDREWK